MIRNKSRGFTLIELLVVIAIIAILAAILFPVFAQAKASAKAAASISNAKQTVTAAQIYSADFDDYAPLSQLYTLGAQTDPSQILVGWSWISIWTTLIQPYMKNRDINMDPAGPRWRIRTERSWTAAQSQANMPSYAYHSGLWSPLPNTTGTRDYQPISMTSVQSPAETVMFAASMMQWVDSEFAFFWNFGSGIGWLSAGNIDAPACANPFNTWCGQGWGNNFNWTTLINAQQNQDNGRRSGGVSSRVARQGVFAFGDGHVKRMPLSRAAAGTNWTPDIDNFSVVVNDRSRYLWDAE